MASEKTCFKCLSVKPLYEFYAHPMMADGRLNKCKECTKRDANEHRQRNLERIREYDAMRANHLQAPPFKTSRKQTERDRIRRLKYKNSVDEKRKQYTVLADASAKFHKSLPRTPPSLDLPTLLHHNGLLP